MKELSIFIDESGDFGSYSKHAPYYIVTMVFHDQSIPIKEKIDHLDFILLTNNERTLMHSGPIIRKEKIYKYMSIEERRYLFNAFYWFTLGVDITFKSLVVDKIKLSNNDFELMTNLTKQLSSFIKENLEYFISFDKVIVYYDGGQKELNTILNTVFHTLLSNIEFRKVKPENYKLFQVADLLCTLELLSIKFHNNSLSHSEEMFFQGRNKLKKNYLKILKKKSFDNLK